MLAGCGRGSAVQQTSHVHAPPASTAAAVAVAPVTPPRKVSLVATMQNIVAHWAGLKTLDPAASGQTFLLVDVAQQRLYQFKQGALVATWPVSTSRYGTGERAGSLKTPLGLFEITGKVGAGLPKLEVLNRNGSAGWAAQPVYARGDANASKFIVSRIVMLQGLEPGWNRGGDVDTAARHIYIHGTPDIGGLGAPASEGCVQMAPAAVIRLFQSVSPGTLVMIVPSVHTLPAVPGATARA